MAKPLDNLRKSVYTVSLWGIGHSKPDPGNRRPALQALGAQLGAWRSIGINS